MTGGMLFFSVVAFSQKKHNLPPLPPPPVPELKAEQTVPPEKATMPEVNLPPAPPTPPIPPPPPPPPPKKD